jgi:hypothetical protein
MEEKFPVIHQEGGWVGYGASLDSVRTQNPYMKLMLIPWLFSP